LQLACKCYNHTLMSSIAYWRNGLYTQRSVHRVTEGSKLQANTRRSRRLIRIKCTISSRKLTSPKLRSTKLLWGRDKTDFVGNLMITLVKATRNTIRSNSIRYQSAQIPSDIFILYETVSCENTEKWAQLEENHIESNSSETYVKSRKQGSLCGTHLTLVYASFISVIFWLEALNHVFSDMILSTETSRDTIFDEFWHRESRHSRVS